MNEKNEIKNEIREITKDLKEWASLQKSMIPQKVNMAQYPNQRDIYGRVPIKNWRDIMDSTPEYSGYSEEEWVDLVLQNDVHGLLRKSFVGDSSANPSSLHSLVRENLDPLMIDVQLKEHQLTLLNSIERVCTPTRTSQRVRFDQRGAGPGRGFLGFGEGLTARHGGGDRFHRVIYKLVQQGVIGATTDWAAATGAHMTENPVMLEHRNRMMELLSNINTNLMFGDRRVNKSDTGIEYEYDGFLRVMEEKMPNHIIDLQKDSLSYDKMTEAAVILSNDALMDDLTGRVNCVTTPGVVASLASDLSTNTRVFADSEIGRNIIPGSVISGVNTNIGFIPFHQTRAMNPVPNNMPVSPRNVVDNVPVLPIPKTPGPWDFKVASVTDPSSLIKYSNGGGLKTGTYTYWVAASSTYGESLPSKASVPEAANSGNGITITIEPLASEKNPVVAWKIYRADEASAPIEKARWIATVPHGYVNGEYDPSFSGQTVYTDVNQYIPGTDFAIIKSIDPSDVNIGQLIPVVKRPWSHPDYATSNLFILFTIMCLRVWKPESVVIIKNIKPVDYNLGSFYA